MKSFRSIIVEENEIYVGNKVKIKDFDISSNTKKPVYATIIAYTKSAGNDKDKVTYKIGNKEKTVAVNVFKSKIVHESKNNNLESVEESVGGIPTGIKLYFIDKKGKETYSIYFTAADAQKAVNDHKKTKTPITDIALMYGKKEGPKQKSPY